MGEHIEFTKAAVKEYLDRCISFWRREDVEGSKYYIDAYQSVRTSLFGKLKSLERGIRDDEHST